MELLLSHNLGETKDNGNGSLHTCATEDKETLAAETEDGAATGERTKAGCGLSRELMDGCDCQLGGASVGVDLLPEPSRGFRLMQLRPTLFIGD